MLACFDVFLSAQKLVDVRDLVIVYQVKGESQQREIKIRVEEDTSATEFSGINIQEEGKLGRTMHLEVEKVNWESVSG